MSPRPHLLAQLVRDDHYVIDEHAVAEAIVMRTLARRAVPDLSFRSANGAAAVVRSFRCHRDARSFRLVRARAA
jgi:hypothetical protein